MQSEIIALALILCATSAVPVRAQPPAARPEVLAADDAIVLANGWGRLAEGNMDKAAEAVAILFSRSPRSLPALMLAIEVDIARSGAQAALLTYERWLGPRTVEAPFVLRRVARALLYEAARLDGQPTARLDALHALAADGDAAANAILLAEASRGGSAETRVLAAIGNRDAVSQLLVDLRRPGGNKVALIEALADSGDAQAVPPLLQALDDPRPEHRAAAARALGRLRAGQAIPRLRIMLSDPRAEVRYGAAMGLAAMDDFSSQEQLQAWLHSEVESQQVMAAEALANRPDDTWHAVVRQLTRSNDANVLVAAARLIAPYDPALARAVVDRLLVNPNIVVRESAGRVLARHVAGDFRTLRALFRAPDPIVRVGGAVRVLELSR